MKSDWEGTPLHAACIYLGPNIQEKDQQQSKQLETIKNILKLGASINAEDSFCNTPLHIATNRAGQIVIELLIEMGADIEHMNEKLNTALHIAAMNNNEAAIRVLLTHHANHNAENIDGETPMQCASKDIARFIETIIAGNNCMVNTSEYAELKNRVILLEKNNKILEARLDKIESLEEKIKQLQKFIYNSQTSNVPNNIHTDNNNNSYKKLDVATCSTIYRFDEDTVDTKESNIQISAHKRKYATNDGNQQKKLKIDQLYSKNVNSSNNSEENLF